jgi:uncharacterized protein YggE
MKQPFMIGATVFALAMPLAAHASEEPDIDAGTLTVTGEAIQAVENTAAQVTFGVQTNGVTSSEVVQANTELLATVFARVQSLGIDISDFETDNISLRQTANQETGAPTGYEMNNSVHIYVSDIKILGDVMTAATNAGVNRIDSVQMVPQKGTVDMDKLRTEAAEDAILQARLYTEALGLEIIGIQSVNEANGENYPVPMRSMLKSDAMESMPVAGGSSDFSSRLNVTYFVRIAD